MARSLSFALLICSLAACPHQKTDPGQAPTGTTTALDIASFSETQPFTGLTVSEGALYAGTPAGLVRFDMQSGDFKRVTKEQGLPGNNVSALSADSRTGLWIATEAGISRLQNNSWTTVKPGGSDVYAAMAATGNGLWAGSQHGLGRFEDGKWKSYLPGARVTFLLRAIDEIDGLWVGTEGEGIYRYRGGQFTSHSPTQGQAIRRVRNMTYTADMGLFAVGSDGGGDRLTFFDGTHWTSYSLQPAGRLHWVQLVGTRTFVGYEDRVLTIERVGADVEPGREAQGPVKLVGVVSPQAPAGYPVPRFTTRAADFWLPPNPTLVVGHNQRMLMATRTTGAALYDGRRVTWFRTNDLVGDGTRLRMGCAAGTCYVAGGAGRAYRSDGRSFTPLTLGDGGSRTLAFLNDRSGAVLAIQTPVDGKSLVVSRVSGTQMAKQSEAKIVVPEGGRLEVYFARFDPAGKLWVGLGYIDKDEHRPWGAAVLTDGGGVTYHRSTLLPTEDRPSGSLALPDDIRDVTFVGGEVWLATGAGVCRVRGITVDLFTENEGLESEIVYSIARNAKGEMLAATQSGVGRYDGKWWRFGLSGPLATSTHVLYPAGETIWAGTARGVMQWVAQGKDRVIDAKQGLASDTVLDLAIDSGRMWILTDKGISVLTL
jgi:hypothetical protein